MEISGPSGKLQIALTLLVGVATVGYGAYSYDAQTAALDSTVEVDATLTDVSVEEHAGKGDTYSPKATYEYTYEGETYTSANVYPGKLPREFGSREKARSQIDGGPGDTITAHVPTDDPGNAFLKHKTSDKPLLVVGFGFLFVLGAAYSIVKGRY
ncbi:DUF3592 domain-containing protein [Halobacterium litoreum]|uniref:DUF3592 domain-containing protein n=1 Tax=Halobacterium litoreum TaxID=2039234 RepID=A0ABD5NDJ8_9EURY|nr:DUF3592 domain-containing protein [Halobacterium litoreum]UHH13693.1 DUF3592 domain-containing protein [Halobacterium litoreum]